MASRAWDIVYKVDPKKSNFFRFFLVDKNEYCRLIAIVEMPADDMLGANVKAADEIVMILKKRLRRSI